MIRVLRFGEPKSVGDAKVKSPMFVARSTLPLQAACLVAAGVGEQMKRLLGSEVEVDLIAPIIPDNAARAVLFDDGPAYRVRGRLCDVFLSLRQPDAGRLSAIIFGESKRPERDPLSEIERATLERVLPTLGSLCAPLCGDPGPVVAEQGSRAAAECVTYFEVRMVGTGIAIGFSLTADPAEETTQCFRWDDFWDVRLEGRVVCAGGEATLGFLADLEHGKVLPLPEGLDERGSLYFEDQMFAWGTCGVQDDRSAFLVGAP